MAEGDLSRIFERLDKLSREVGEVKALLNAKNLECDRQDEILTELRHRITEAEKKNVEFSGGVNFIAWLITAAIAAYGVFLK